MIVAIIPARLEASRFPKKLIQPLGDKTVIATTYLNTLNTGLFKQVIVVTDSLEIKKIIEDLNGICYLSSQKHECGTDRIAEIAAQLNTEIVVNVQGDEPFVTKENLQKIIHPFLVNKNLEISTIASKIKNLNKIKDNNCVKVVFDLNGFALFFSRNPIPFNRDHNPNQEYFEHIGIYGFRKDILLKITSQKPTPLELAEKLENLRMLEMGLKIKISLVNQYYGIKIDTPEELVLANHFLGSGQYKI